MAEIINSIKTYRIAGLLLLSLVLFGGCKYYNFTGGDPGLAETFQVDYFKNYASQSPGSTFEPGLDRDFTIALQEVINNQTRLELTNSNPDVFFEGEIVEYRISPMSATAQQNAAQNRLTMSVQVRYYNTVEEDKDFDQRFSFFFDYPATSQLASVQDEAHQIIFERITQDIFNKAFADW